MRLCVAAARGDHSVRIAAACLTQHLARFFVAHRGHRAGVDDVGVGFFLKADQLVTAALKLLLKRLRFILIHLAAQGADGDSHGYDRSFPLRRRAQKARKNRSFAPWRFSPCYFKWQWI